jgi:tetratricopeptide (TPR) repeat protein
MMNAGRYGELEATLREVIREHPLHGLAWKALGVTLRMQGKEALAALQTAVNLLPADAEAQRNLGHARFDLGQLEEAVHSYQLALQIKPDMADLHNDLGNALRGLGRFDVAAASYARALESDPAHVRACMGLGNALLHLGRFEAAVAAYRRTLAIDPDRGEAYSNLGNALRGLGQLDEAVASYRQALAMNPKFAVAYSNLGDTLRDLGRLEEAVLSSRRALAIDPDLAAAHNGLGNALLDLRQLELAAASHRRAIELNPGFTAAHINLGLVLRQQGLTADAEACCKTALETNPRSAPALVLLAELRADSGQFAQADALLRNALAVDPESAAGVAGMAHLRKMTVGDAAWAAQAQRLADRSLPPRQEAGLRFAIGKFFDDTQDYAAAFTNFRRANELSKLSGGKHDRRRLTHTIEQLIEAYDSNWASRSRENANTSARPIFIVGMPRSGTTLAEQILASHPDVFGGGELSFWNKPTPAGALLEPTQRAAEYLRLLENLSAEALRVIDKMPANFFSLGAIHAALPNARFIHMRRDPIDTCLSIYFQQFGSGHAYASDLGDLAHYYTEYLRLMEHWRRVLPKGTMLEVPYESLVVEQESWTRKMLQFIDVPWDPRCIEFHATERSVMSASKWQVRQKMSNTAVGRRFRYEQFLGPLRRLPDPLRLDTVPGRTPPA